MFGILELKPTECAMEPIKGQFYEVISGPFPLHPTLDGTPANEEDQHEQHDESVLSSTQFLRMIHMPTDTRRTALRPVADWQNTAACRATREPITRVHPMQQWHAFRRQQVKTIGSAEWLDMYRPYVWHVNSRARRI